MEDATQEVFISLWENAGRYDPAKGAEVTFVAMIARRRLIDSGRRYSQRQKLTEAAKTVQRPEPTRFDEQVAQADEARRASQAIETLGEDQRKVLKLAIHQGLTHNEIARSTGLPLGTVKTHARRGLMKVRQLLSEKDAAKKGASS